MSSIASLNATMPCCASGLSLTWTLQSHGLDKDLSPGSVVYGNRLYKHMDGSLEVIPKTPCEVLGERVIRPLLDSAYRLTGRTVQVLKGGLSFVDNQISKLVNFLPVAQAVVPNEDESMLEKCLASNSNLEYLHQSTEKSLETGNPLIVTAVYKVYEAFFNECFEDAGMQRAKEVHKQNIEKHDREKKILQEKIKDCNDSYGPTYCYSHPDLENGAEPQIFLHTFQHTVNGATVESFKWTTTPGYLSWQVYAYKWWRPDIFVSSGGYNYDPKTKKSTVPIRSKV